MIAEIRARWVEMAARSKFTKPDQPVFDARSEMEEWIEGAARPASINDPLERAARDQQMAMDIDFDFA